MITPNSVGLTHPDHVHAVLFESSIPGVHVNCTILSLADGTAEYVFNNAPRGLNPEGVVRRWYLTTRPVGRRELYRVLVDVTRKQAQDAIDLERALRA